MKRKLFKIHIIMYEKHKVNSPIIPPIENWAAADRGMKQLATRRFREAFENGDFDHLDIAALDVDNPWIEMKIFAGAFGFKRDFGVCWVEVTHVDLFESEKQLRDRMRDEMDN